MASSFKINKEMGELVVKDNILDEEYMWWKITNIIEVSTRGGCVLFLIQFLRIA